MLCQWWCPEGGLEHRCLSIQGWRELRYLVDDAKQTWVLMVMP